MRPSGVQSISRGLAWTNILASGVALLLACSAFFTYDLLTFRNTMVRSLSIQANIIGANSVSALVFDDPQSAENTLGALSASPDISFAAIYTTDGKPFAAYNRDSVNIDAGLPVLAPQQREAHSFNDSQVVLAQRILFKGRETGTVYIRSDLREIDQRWRRYGLIALAVLLTSLVAALLFSAGSRRAISTPIVGLAEVARVVSRDKDYSLRATPTARRDELAVLIDAFNEMLGQIQSRDEALQKARDELEQRVTERTAELAAANKELEAFSYSVSHDLRAPLRHIDGFSSILASKYSATLDPAGQQLLSRVRDGAKRMGQLIDDLLGFARVGRQEISRKSVDPNALVQLVLQELQPECENRDIRWSLGTLPLMDCDPGLMKVVFTNLLSNAVKYTRNTPTALIVVDCAVDNGRKVIFIKDNGAGFEQQYAPKLFGVFQRLHRREEFEGTGVGLATVQRIIHKHGGQIWAEAEVNKGATFYFTITDGRINSDGANA